MAGGSDGSSRELSSDIDLIEDMGIPIVIIEPIMKTYQVRRHKKFRTNKKWLKRYGTRTVEESKNKVYCSDTSMFMTQETYDKLKAGINRKVVEGYGKI